MSKIVTYSEVRNHLKTYLDYVVDNSEEIIITRKNGKEVVLISKEDYDSMDETAYLLSNPKTKERLLNSVEEINRGDWKNWKSYNSIEDLLQDGNE